MRLPAYKGLPSVIKTKREAQKILEAVYAGTFTRTDPRVEIAKGIWGSPKSRVDSAPQPHYQLCGNDAMDHLVGGSVVEI